MLVVEICYLKHCPKSSCVYEGHRRIHLNRSPSSVYGNICICMVLHSSVQVFPFRTFKRFIITSQTPSKAVLYWPLAAADMLHKAQQTHQGPFCISVKHYSSLSRVFMNITAQEASLPSFFFFLGICTNGKSGERVVGEARNHTSSPTAIPAATVGPTGKAADINRCSNSVKVSMKSKHCI